jgi:hypothetical protein
LTHLTTVTAVDTPKDSTVVIKPTDSSKVSSIPDQVESYSFLRALSIFGALTLIVI